MSKEFELCGSAYSGNVERVTALLKQGVNPNCADDIGQTPLLFAARNGHTEVVKALLDGGADVDNVSNFNKRTALYEAAIRFHYDTAKVLIAAGGDINHISKDGVTPLHHILLQDNSGIPLRAGVVRQFIAELNPDVNKGSERGDTPLVFAAFNRQTEAMKELIEAGADVNKSGVNENIPLHTALRYKSFENVQILLKAGSDVNRANKYGQTPLHTAVYEQDVRYITALLKAGADINQADNTGTTPLMFAVGLNSIEGTALLLAAGVDKHIVDKDGKTAMDIAKKKDNKDIMYLLNHMVIKNKPVKVASHNRVIQNQNTNIRN